MNIPIDYAAGFFDAEGSVVIRDNGEKGFSVRVSIGNTYKPVLDAFLVRFGGALFSDKRNYSTNFGYKKRHQWYVSGKKALPFLLAVSGSLREKKEIALLAIDAIFTLGKTGCAPGRKGTLSIKTKEKRSRILASYQTIRNAGDRWPKARKSHRGGT